MKPLRPHLAAVLAALAVAALPGGSAWAQQTWSTALDACTIAGTGTATTGNCSSSGTAALGNVSATVWGAQTAGSGANNGAQTASGAAFVRGQIAESGLGYGLLAYLGTDNPNDPVGTPSRALDNSGFTDAVLLKFSQPVTLDKLTIGWGSGDSDLSLFAYTGSGTTESAVMGGTAVRNGVADAAAVAIGSAWTLVGNYGDADNPNCSETFAGQCSDVPINVNSAKLSSSWWLVSAYNSRYGGACQNGGSSSVSCSDSNDSFKLLAAAGKTSASPPPPPQSSVPEPDSLALVGLALLGLAARRRARAAVRACRVSP